jgi:hypothetical protein
LHLDIGASLAIPVAIDHHIQFRVQEQDVSLKSIDLFGKIHRLRLLRLLDSTLFSKRFASIACVQGVLFSVGSDKLSIGIID